jgi:hypothetical protein
VYLTVVARHLLGKNHPVIVRQQLGTNVTMANKYAHNGRRIVGCVIFYAVRVVSCKVSDWFFPQLRVSLGHEMMFFPGSPPILPLICLLKSNLIMF